MTSPLARTHRVACLISTMISVASMRATVPTSAASTVIASRWCMVSLMTWMRRMTTPLVCVTTVTTRILITTVSAVTALVLLSSVPNLVPSGRLARRINHRAARVTLGLITTTLVTTLMATTSWMMNNWRSLLVDHRWCLRRWRLI